MHFRDGEKNSKVPPLLFVVLETILNAFLPFWAFRSYGVLVINFL
jgi:hypothetical protein